MDALKNHTASETRKLLISRQSGRVPFSVPLLNQWQYLEWSVQRLLAAWGRRMKEWNDKAVLHRHVWDQAEIVRRLRERIKQFPGGKPDAGVPVSLQVVADTLLAAPSFEDVLDGIYRILLKAQLTAYVDHVQNAHPVHDAPSIALLHEINTIKAQQHAWYRDYRRRNPHATDRAYEDRVQSAIALNGGLTRAIPQAELVSPVPCRPASGFRLPKISSRPEGWAPEVDFYPYFSSDFATDVEARRLFWGVAYLHEMNVPDDQLAWLFYGHYMPWEWHYDIARHLWDESRHGCSGYSRLQDWGITMHDVGFRPYELIRTGNRPLIEKVLNPVDEKAVDFDAPMEPLSPQTLYEAVFHIGMVAESGHFIVKNEAYDDFREAEDLESAEMMLFDIIDETAHVQYAHRWLPLLAEHAGIDNSNYKQRALKERKALQEAEDQLIAEAGRLPRDSSFAPWRHYQHLLAKVRASSPIQETERYSHRSRKPM